MKTSKAALPAPVKQQIAVACNRGKVIVDAEVYGPLALHQGVGTLRPWAISHLGTGLLVNSFENRGEAWAFLQKVLKLGLDWNFSTPAAIPPETAATMRRVCGRRPQGGMSSGLKIEISIEVK